MAIDLTVIQSNPYFSSLNPDDFSRLIQHVAESNLRANDILFSEGDFADAFYIVKEGAIRISSVDSHGNVIILARIGEGGFFGEQAFSPASSPRRRAAAMALSDAVLYRFPRDIIRMMQQKNTQLQTILQTQDTKYLKAKLFKLAQSIQQTSYNLENEIGTSQQFPKRSIVFYQGDSASYAYMLVSGEIELRRYDENKQISQVISIGPGQLFGREVIQAAKKYSATAVVKCDATIIPMDLQQYHKMVEANPLLKELGADFNEKFSFKSKGKLLQFRGEHAGLPAITSILTLPDGREVVFQQMIGADIFLASLANTMPTQEIKYALNQDSYREMSLVDNKIICLVDKGSWDDSHALLDLMVDGVTLTQDQIADFTSTGHMTVLDENKKSEDELVCHCMRVSYGAIKKLIATEKFNFNEISCQTGAGTICGGCKPAILDMLGTSAWSPCIISRIIEHNADIKSFQLQPLDGKTLPFKPGQYLVVKARIDNAWVQRHYTLTSLPNQSYYEITIKKEPKGLFSPWLFEHADENLLLYIAGPYGQFTLETTRDSPIVCFMGGIGVTPAVAFSRHLLCAHSQQRIYIDYSASVPEQFILKDEFLHIAKDHPNINMHHRATRLTGKLDEDEIKKIITSAEGCHIYLCGPKNLEQLVMETVNKLHLEPSRLHVEQFIHAGAPDNAPQLITLE